LLIHQFSYLFIPNPPIPAASGVRVGHAVVTLLLGNLAAYSGNCSKVTKKDRRLKIIFPLPSW